MKKTKMIVCLILSISIGIIAAAPLLNAEIFIKPWITRVQGPTAPFTFEVVYADFTITDPDAPTNQIAPSQDHHGLSIIGNVPPTTARIDYNIVINVTNPSEYRTILSSTSFFAAQEVHETTRQAILNSISIPSSSGRGIEAKGAWVDGVYYNITCTIPWPTIDENGVVIETPWESIGGGQWSFRDSEGNTRTNENSTIEEYKNAYNARFYEWKEGIQGYEYSITNDKGITNKYIYLNIDGTWVDVTGRVTFDKEPEPETAAFSSKGGFASQFVNYGSGSKTSRENGYNYLFEPGESRLLIISGSSEVKPAYAEISEIYINPIDIIQSGTVYTLIQGTSIIDMEFDMETYLEDHTVIDTHINAAAIQELALTQVGNSYIYNTVLSDNQTFQLDKYGFEVFIVPVR